MKTSELKEKLETFVSYLNKKSRGVNEDGYTYKYRLNDRKKRVFVNREFSRGMCEPWFEIDKESTLISGVDVNDFIRVDEMDFYDYMRLCNLIIEYLNTPLEEREDEKRWYIHLFKGGCDYLNQDKEKGTYDLDTKYEITDYKTKFTRSEIEDWAGTSNDDVIDWIIGKFGEEV